MSTVLIISSAQDGHVDPVLQELARRGVGTRLIDPALYLESGGLSVKVEERLSAKFRSSEAEVGLDCSSEVASVWYRRPSDIPRPQALLAEEGDWYRRECQHLLSGVWADSDCLWVSKPDAVNRASLKLPQLALARRLGLSVPRTIVTNEPDEARRFLSACDAGAVVKALSAPYVFYPGRGAATLYTHLIGVADMERIDDVKTCPTMLQQFIRKAADVRVTVIGEQVFGVSIESQDSEDTAVDFRRSGDRMLSLRHEPLVLPEMIEERCRSMLRHFGLEFGAFDFALTEDGTYYFLEVNPNGQWLWLEWATGIPLTAALCDLLMTKVV